MAIKSRDIGIGISPTATLLFFILHIFIALLARNSPTFSTNYALAIFLIGALAALMGKDSVVICIVSYIVGGECLWRMTKADIYWEFGKYAISGILILAILRRRHIQKSVLYLMLYFLLLLPAIRLTRAGPYSQWRQIVSVNISGPFSLCLCGLYFSGLALNKKDLQRMLTWLIAPIISIAFLVILGIRETPDISWGLGSSKAASAGYGPNQVASILGLGAFLCIVFCALAKGGRIIRIIYISASAWFFSQALLTFSRGGIVGAGISSLIFGLVIIKGRRNKFLTLCLGILFIFLLHSFLIPKLDQYTSGMLKPRYKMHEKLGEIEVYHTSGRLALMLADIQSFKNNPLWGLGVGNSVEAHHKVTGIPAMPHTEWTRALAEHGMFGLFSLFFLWIWALKRYRRWSMEDPVFRAMALSFIAGIVLYMGHSAMRLVIPSFMIGLLGADLKLTE